MKSRGSKLHRSWVLLWKNWTRSRCIFVIMCFTGFSLLLDVFCALHGPREKCVEILRSGHLLAISPGGVREALLSDETYSIIWGNRKGFAQVAIDAQVVSCQSHYSSKAHVNFKEMLQKWARVYEARFFYCNSTKVTIYKNL